MVNWITINRFSLLTGYSERAVRAKISEGVWLKHQVWCKAPDGRILLSIRGYEAWVEGRAFAPLAQVPSR